METKFYSIEEAANYLNLHSHYVRKLVREGKIETEMVNVTPTSKVKKHMISQVTLDNYKKNHETRTNRTDGRNKYTIYLNQEELESLLKNNPDLRDLISRSNPSKSEK